MRKRGLCGSLPQMGLALIFGVLPAWAAAAPADGILVQHRQCLACHQVKVKRVGPSFEAIGKRYAGAPEAVQYLASTIRQGSRQKWGAIPMPAQPAVNPEEAVQLALWILSLAGDTAARSEQSGEQAKQ